MKQRPKSETDKWSLFNDHIYRILWQIPYNIAISTKFQLPSMIMLENFNTNQRHALKIPLLYLVYFGINKLLNSIQFNIVNLSNIEVINVHFKS